MSGGASDLVLAVLRRPSSSSLPNASDEGDRLRQSVAQPTTSYAAEVASGISHIALQQGPGHLEHGRFRSTCRCDAADAGSLPCGSGRSATAAPSLHRNACGHHSRPSAAEQAAFFATDRSAPGAADAPCSSGRSEASCGADPGTVHSTCTGQRASTSNRSGRMGGVGLLCTLLVAFSLPALVPGAQKAPDDPNSLCPPVYVRRL
jgi:hypothetical protein